MQNKNNSMLRARGLPLYILQSKMLPSLLLTNFTEIIEIVCMYVFVYVCIYTYVCVYMRMRVCV